MKNVENWFIKKKQSMLRIVISRSSIKSSVVPLLALDEIRLYEDGTGELICSPNFKSSSFDMLKLIF